MRLLSAGALWWLLAGVPIIIFYMLKLRRKRRVVPSVLLWQRALEEVEANAPFKKLRRSLLLLLQLLALAALVLALARPLLKTRALASGSAIIVIDATASMSARDENGRSRLDRARELAREMIRGLGSGDRAAIIESSSRVIARAPLTSDSAALAAALDDVRETDSAGNLSDAILLAEQIAKAEREASIVVIGDGGGSELDGEPAGARAAAGAPLRFVRVGRGSDNLGLVAMNSRPARASGRLEMFASIASFGPEDRQAPVELRIDGKLVDARTILVKANDRTALVFDSLPPSGGLAELRLRVDDDLAADNVAYTMLPDARRLRVGVAAENPFLLQALAVNPDFSARRLGPDGDLSKTEFDCVVSEGDISSSLVASDKPLLAINPSDVAGLWQAEGERERPEITSVDRGHPVNSYLSYADLHIESFRARTVAGWLKPLVSSQDRGLVWAGDDGRRRVAVIGFDLAKSDLPLKVEFPLLLDNAISWLTGRERLAAERAVRAGQPVTLVSADANVSVTLPDGDSREVAVRDGSAAFADTLRVGVYEVKGSNPFAVSLLSQNETDTRPRDSIKTRAGEVSAQAETFSSEHEAWRWAAIAALAVLAIEWWVYHRRIAA